RIDIHGAIVNQQGIVRADSLQGTGGNIVLKASQTLMLSGDSRTTVDGGDEGKGGQIQLLGRHVGLTDRAVVSASGAAGGGQVLVGGGQEGKDASVPNSEAVYFGKNASIQADATANGEGGRIILWSDKATRAYGSLSARGGAAGGDGGFIETSGGWLDARPVRVATFAPKGSSGTWLLDPYDLIISHNGFESNFDSNIGTETTFFATGTPSRIYASTINAALGGGYDGAGHVRITTGGAGPEAGNITFDSVSLNGGYSGGSSLLVQAAGSITVNNSSFTNASSEPSDTIKLTFNAAGNVSFANVSMPKAGGLRITGADITLLNTNVDSQFIAIDIAASGRLSLGTSTVLKSTMSGDAIILHTARFQNGNFGTQALQTPTPGSRWLIHGVDAANGSDFAPGNLSYAFKQYGGGSILGSGNGFVFSKAESAQLSSDTIQKVYDAGTGVPAITNLQVTPSVPGDKAIGTPSTAGAAYSDKNVGFEKLVTLPALGLSFFDANERPVYGYTLGSLVGAITPATLLVSGIRADNKVYDGSATAIFSGTPSYTVLGNDDVQITGLGSGTFFTKHVGQGRGVQFFGFSVSGADASNYNVVAAGSFGADITPAPLVVTGLTAANKVYDGSTAATLSGVPGVSPLGGDVIDLQGSATGQFADKNVGSAKPVSLSGLTLGGADAGNYVLALPVGLNADITPAPLALTGLTAANKVYDAGTAANLNGTAQIVPQGQDQLILSGTAVGSFADKNVGTAKPVAVSGLSLEGADAGNYSLQSALSADISRLNLSINGLSVADKVYNANTAGGVSGTASVTPLEGDSVFVGNGSLYRAAFTDKNAGTGKAVTVIPQQLNVGSQGPLLSDTVFALAGPDAGNYSVAPTLSLTANVAKADLAINGLLADSKIYDGTAGATLNISGVVLAPLGTDQVSIASGASGVFADKNVGTGKFVNVTTFALSGPDAANYNPAVPLTLRADITPRAAQLVGVTAASKVYDGLTQASVAGGGVTGLLAGDQVSLNSGTASFADKNVGTNKAVALQGFDLGGADAGNYTLSVAGGLSADITPAALSVSGLAAQSKVYDASTIATLTGAAQLKPFNGDAVTLSPGTASFVDKNVGTAKSVLLSGFTLGGADAGNYVLQPIATLSADITPAPLAISGVAANSKVYDARSGATLTANATVQALGTDSVTVGGSASASFGDKNVGTGKSVSVTGYTLGGADAANYTVSQPAGLSANITPATLLLDGVGVADKVYDTTTAATLTGAAGISALGGDIVSVDAGSASARFADRNVGTSKRVIVGNFSLSGADADNYTLQMPGNLTASITPASLSVIGISADNKVYDAGTAATLRGSATVQALGTDSVSLSGTAVARFADKNVGAAKNVSVSGLALSGADAGNYRLNPPAELRADITAANLTIVGISANNKVYDATLVASLSGSAIVQALAGDSVGVAGNASASFDDKNVGTGKSVSVSGLTLSGADAGNYRAVAPALTAGITPASLQYVARPVSKAIGEVLPALNGSVTGFVGGETQQTATSGALSFSSEVDVQTPAGSYAVRGAGLSAQNYGFVQAPGNAAAFTVTGVSPTATLNQGATVAASNVLTAPLITPSSAAAGLLDLLQAPAAGSPAAAAAAPAAAALGSTGGAAAAPSFTGMRLGDMSPDALAGMLASRDRYKKSLFADATARLEQNATLADLRICKTQGEVAAGDCLLTDELKRQLQAAKATEELAQLQARSASTQAVPGQAVAASAEPRGLTVNLGQKRRVKTASLPQIERKLALVIGIDDYQDKSIPQLGNAVKDARAIGGMFDGALGYETVVIPNASKQAVVSALTKLALELGPKDSVVIYYAGHGELVESTGLGYWQLADADAKKPETWLSNADIGRMIAQIGASQVALISDSCYSGSLVSDERIRATPGGADPQAVLARKSVVVMSSGGNEPVFDEGKNGHSPFAWNLMNQLRQVSSWQAGGNVFERVRFAVAKELPQRPKYGSSSAAGHQAGGDYLFEQRQLEAGTQ
ncbi:MAG: caspase family protein, partial [Burkholderiaceae bacterium]|nr:caspase family protein [Burkholderiaceae bacterium]